MPACNAAATGPLKAVGSTMETASASAPLAIAAFMELTISPAHKAAIDGGKLTVVSADTLPAELDELKKGEVAALVGQQPFAMGAKAMEILLSLAQGKTEAPIQYVGLDVVTKDNVAQYMTN